jgi:hypothetical protein
MLNLTISFAPYIPGWLLWTAGTAAAVLVIYAFARRARGARARAQAVAVKILGRAHPQIVP